MNQQKVWDRIAEKWYSFRHWPIKEVKKLNWKKGCILDLGCGNCRNLLPFKNLDCYGIDFSKEMLKQARLFCKKNNFKVKLTQANITKLPYKSNFLDYILAIAVLHHLRNPKPAIKEIYRVLKPRGQAYITIWNKLQPRFLFRKKQTYIKWGKEKRYYNFISFLEMRKLLKNAGFTILKSKLFGKNLEFLVTK